MIDISSIDQFSKFCVKLFVSLFKYDCQEVVTNGHLHPLMEVGVKEEEAELGVSFCFD